MDTTEVLESLKLSIQKNQVRVKINELPVYCENSEDVVLDVEHDEAGNFVGAGFLFPPDECVYYFTSLELVSRLGLNSRKLIGHNLVSDIEMLRFWGINLDSSARYWDTMLFAHILDSSLKDYSLKGTVKRELGIEYPTYDEIVGKKTLKQKNPRMTLDKQPLEVVSLYNAMDVFSTYKLYEKQRHIIGL